MIVTKRRIIYPLSMFGLGFGGFVFGFIGLVMIIMPDETTDLSTYIVGAMALCLGLGLMVWSIDLQVRRIPGGIKLSAVGKESMYRNIESIDLERGEVWWGMPTYEYVFRMASEEEPLGIVSLTSYPLTVSKKKRQLVLETLREWAGISGRPT